MLHPSLQYTQWNLFQIALNRTEIRLYLPFSSIDPFAVPNRSRKMVNTIWFWVYLKRFGKDFSCEYDEQCALRRQISSVTKTKPSHFIPGEFPRDIFSRIASYIWIVIPVELCKFTRSALTSSNVTFLWHKNFSQWETSWQKFCPETPKRVFKIL